MIWRPKDVRSDVELTLVGELIYTLVGALTVVTAIIAVLITFNKWGSLAGLSAMLVVTGLAHVMLHISKIRAEKRAVVDKVRKEIGKHI